jgi:hypothetical protein
MSPRPIAHEYCEGNVLPPRSGDKSETGWINRSSSIVFCNKEAGSKSLPSCNTDRGVPRLGESLVMKRRGAGKPILTYFVM